MELRPYYLSTVRIDISVKSGRISVLMKLLKYKINMTILLLMLIVE